MIAPANDSSCDSLGLRKVFMFDHFIKYYYFFFFGPLLLSKTGSMKLPLSVGW